MKTIKFRALKDDMSDFRFVYGNLIYDYQDNPRIQEDKNEPTFTTCIKGTERQFTGLLDKNGKEIFEQMELNNIFIIKWLKFRYVLFYISNLTTFEEIFDYENKLEITGEYTEL